MTRRKDTITIRDVAQKTGFSVATISRYINKVGNVSPDTANRIQNVMDELNYFPSAIARKLATRRTETIGLVINEIAGDYVAPLLSGIESTARKNGYDLLIASAGYDRRRKRPTVSLGPFNVDGLLVFAGTLADDHIYSFYQQKFPMVFIHSTPPQGLNIPGVTVENKAASFNLVSHLIRKHDKQRVVYLRGPLEMEDSHWREQGYLEALHAAGLPEEPELVAQGNFSRDTARSAIHKLVQSGVTFDAVFAGDDEAAVGVLQALSETGLRVPEEIAVVGFDDQRLAEFLSPSLTTVKSPIEQVGAHGAQTLVDLISGKPVKELLLLPTKLVFRRSCGCGLAK
jgi:DNA-binding LacI/PurR family transcriptional regulator